jgi:RimJ/RimL family protein N-acetyltransferase
VSKQDVVFLRGAKTILRPFNEETDLKLCQKWINDPEIRQFILNSSPFTLGQERKALEKLVERENSVFLIIEVDGRPIGTMGIHNIHHIDRTASTGALIGNKEDQGKGYGKDAKMVLLAHAFFSLNLRKIYSSAIEFNENSRGYQESTGYKVEGVRKKQFFRHGRYWDEILTAVFKEDFDPLWEEYGEKHGL